MDIDTTKENIQPLRGGRNAQQLEMAIQAQTNRELQMELHQKEQEFRSLIENYQGDDPLENYYNYILWIEQCYPKHGHEGNFASILEQCLTLFEDDRRYTNDRRFCKLWIRYFDMSEKPLELYQMMKSKNLCTGCADLYKAWAYYYEAAGDFHSAGLVFEEGKRNLAQPLEELEIAHSNLIRSAGEHLVYGPDENRLMEKRHALTSLRADRAGRVPSVRTRDTNFPPILLDSNLNTAQRSNMMVPVYQTNEMTGGGAAAAPPMSIITVAKTQEMPKENTMKPGPWATVPVKKRVVSGRSTLGFEVLEDECEGIRLPKNHPKECLEDFSDWKVLVYQVPDLFNPGVIPMYPKARVYMEPDTEYSLEELRATRYKGRTETAQEVEYMQETLDHKHESKSMSSFVQTQQTPMLLSYMQQSPQMSFVQSQLAEGGSVKSSQEVSPAQKVNSPFLHSPQAPSMSSGYMHQPFATQVSSLVPNTGNSINKSADSDFDEYVWNSPCDTAKKEPANSYFKVFEQSSFSETQRPEALPKGSAMKTAFNDLTADYLVETGSRGGMDVAAVAQATDSAKPMPTFSGGGSDDSSASPNFREEYDDEESEYSCNTNMFLNLNAMQVSTPRKKESPRPVNVEGKASAKKSLTAVPVRKPNELSMILEETTKSYGSSSSSSNPTMKSSLCNSNKMGTILEEHNSYFAENMMANAALRTSLLGDLVDLPTTPTINVVSATPPRQQVPIYVDEFEEFAPSPLSRTRAPPQPVAARPLENIPSDPFKPKVIGQLLERVSFPGPHGYGYHEISSVSRIMVKKDPINLGKDRYIVEKQLGKGTFGTIYKAFDLRRNQTIAMKFQKPANRWEFYVCREVHSRLATHPLKDRFMNVMFGYFSDQSSILISEYMPAGSLLDLANRHKQKYGKLKESLIMHLCLQMLEIVDTLHRIRIIHGDIKPDNFLVYLRPDNTISLQLIDFGCSIDMSLFPPGAMFTRRVQTEDFICCEMLEGLPWNYHTDLFCIAATAHVLIMDKYIRMKKEGDGTWAIEARLPRYFNEVWKTFFHDLLNQHGGPADSNKLQTMLKVELQQLNRDTGTALETQMRNVVNLLKNQ